MEMKIRIKPRPKSVHRDGQETRLYADKAGDKEIDYPIKYGDTVYIGSVLYTAKEIFLMFDKGWFCKAIFEEF